MGEDGIPDNDLQVVSGERDLENLDPKERAKLQKKRGLIRAGMGAAADDEEDTGFEVAKANSMAMAMLGKRPRPSFAVEGLEVDDERQYGSDQVRGHHKPVRTVYVVNSVRFRIVIILVLSLSLGTLPFHKTTYVFLGHR